MTIPTHVAPPDRDPNDLSIPTGLLTRKQYDDLAAFAEKADLKTSGGRIATAQYIERIADSYRGTSDEGKCPICGSTKIFHYGMCRPCYKGVFVLLRLRSIRNMRGYKGYGLVCVACGKRPVESMGLCHACIQVKSMHKFKTIQDVYNYRHRMMKSILVNPHNSRRKQSASNQQVENVLIPCNYDAAISEFDASSTKAE
jgi:hypothetical protein